MYTCLRSQPSVGILALNFDRRALDSRHFTGIEVDDLAAETMGGTPAHIHALKHLRPILSLGSARAGLNVQKGAMRIHLTAEHALELETANRSFQRGGIALDLTCRRRVVLALGQFQELSGIADGIAGAIEFFELRYQTCAFATKLLSAVLRAPDGGILEFSANFF